MTLTPEQENMLYSLWIHEKCETPDHHDYHAYHLDRLGVPWFIQNAVALRRQ